MNNDIQNGVHVGELMSGYIDGELTQQERQRIEVHCDTCSECSSTLAELIELRETVGNSRLSVTGEDKWRETMIDSTVQTTRSMGWFFFVAGLVVIAGVGLVGFVLTDDIHILMKLLLVAIYGGLASVFFSVIRQRLIEQKNDKYKDVEI